MKQLDVNYVALFRYALVQITNNDLRFRDVAMYYAILQCWNKYRFPKILSVNRHELMSFSKIGSYNTYLKALHSLERKDLIRYYPSKDPCVGSKISICVDSSVMRQNLTLPRHTTDINVSSSLNNTKQDKTDKIPKKKDVIIFFNSKESNENLAVQFFNHNNGLNWMYNGSPIVDWKSFAVNYIDKNKKRSSKSKIKDSKDGTSGVSLQNNFGSF